MLDWLGWLLWYGLALGGWVSWARATKRARRLERERDAALKIRW